VTAHCPPSVFGRKFKNDWVAHGRDWTKPSFRAIAVQRFGVWRMKVEPKVLRAPFSLGRNEGDRLVACLRSAIARSTQVVYVDSGSTDRSLESARSLGVEGIELDLNIPFTAARARNTGLARLLELYPDLEYVQFVDGDCKQSPD
jgi:Glycosyl transferase family 2